MLRGAGNRAGCTGKIRHFPFVFPAFGELFHGFTPQGVERSGGQHDARIGNAGKACGFKRCAAEFQQRLRAHFLLQRQAQSGLRHIAVHGDGVFAVGERKRAFFPGAQLSRHGDAHAFSFLFIISGKLRKHTGCRNNILFRAAAEHIESSFAGEIAIRKAGAGKHTFQRLHIGRFSLQRLPCGGNNGGNILGTFHSALDLKRAYPRLIQLVQMGKQRHIFERKGIFSAVRLEIQPTGLRAKAAVAASCTERGRHIAHSGRAHAVRTVNEHLDFGVYGTADRLDLGKRQLPCRHNAGKSRFLQRFGTGNVMHRHLRGCVQRQRGAMLPHRFRHGEILHDDRIRARCRNEPQGFEHILFFTILDQRVQRDIRLHPAQMARLHGVNKFFVSEVGGVAAGIEAGRAEIHRIRPAAQSRGELFRSPHRSQYFQPRFIM